MSYPHVLTNRSLSITIDGKTFSITNSNPLWKAIVSAIKSRKWSRVKELVDVKTNIRKISDGKVDVKGGKVYYMGKETHDIVAEMILKLQRHKADIKPMMKFLNNLNLNPLESAKKELYLFLDKGKLPITKDGCFLAFKKVRNDYKDVHSGTMDNSVGEVVKMPRDRVDPNRNRTCSTGLHFCSVSYLSQYSGHEKTVIVKINPKDVVAIPSDYNNTKGRTCEYEVVAELGRGFTFQDMQKAIVREMPTDELWVNQFSRSRRK